MTTPAHRDALALLMVGADFAWRLDREPWRDNAACRDHPDVDFFPERGASVEPARRVCAGCPVRRDCLDYALANPSAGAGVELSLLGVGAELQGVWGGTSARQRRRARQQGLTAAELLARLDGQPGADQHAA